MQFKLMRTENEIQDWTDTFPAYISKFMEIDWNNISV